MSKVYNPIFTSDDIYDKLCKLYKLNPVIESMDPSTLITDTDVSYIILGEKCYIVLIKQSVNWRVVVRDQTNLYMDVTTKNNYNIFPFYSNGILFFILDNSTKSTWFIAICDGKISFNRNFYDLNLNSTLTKFSVLRAL